MLLLLHLLWLFKSNIIDECSHPKNTIEEELSPILEHIWWNKDGPNYLWMQQQLSSLCDR